MYEKKNFTYILTILESIEKVYIYTNGMVSAEEFHTQNEQMNFNACKILLMVIGEESKKITDELKEKLIKMLGKVEYEKELLEKVVNTPHYSLLK